VTGQLQRFHPDACHPVKNSMKAAFLILAIIACIFFNCCKKSLPLPAGVIVGWNRGYCMTCGGFYINLSNDTTLNANTYYAINCSSSAQNEVDSLNTKYESSLKPIKVYIQWSLNHLTDTAAPSNWIFVSYIRER
jgi:hypothetical protein